MYFLLSKILLFLLYPVLWVLILFIVSLMVKNSKRKKRFFLAGIVLLYVLSAPVFINVVAWAWSVNPAPVKGPKVYSCAIVLGGFASEGKDGKGYFNGSADRFIQGVMAYKTGRASHILITGGNNSIVPDGFREGAWVKTQLDLLGIPDSAVLIESNSRNTIENASFSKPILQKAGFKPPYLLITSDFHMRRSAMIFKKHGYDVILYPANYTNGKDEFSFYDLIPQGDSIGAWNTYFKEMVGYVVDKFK
jgi:uncharacterized SAM-binding protein YcdF (DUF218 family)